MQFNRLKNIYWAMRHGQSVANLERMIVSDPDNGLSGYGLTPLGRRQVMHSAGEFNSNRDHVTKMRVISSDFLRARQTAQIFSEVTGCPQPVALIPELRERYFGNFDTLSDRYYEEVWAQDERDSSANFHLVESVASIRERIGRLIAALEAQREGEHIIMVSHGDVLQIAQTLFEDKSGSSHRSLPHLGLAEYRRLN